MKEMKELFAEFDRDRSGQLIFVLRNLSELHVLYKQEKLIQKNWASC